MSESLGGQGPLGGTTKAPSLFSGGTVKSERQPERISILSSLDAGGVSGTSGRAIGRPLLFIFAGLLLAGAVIMAARWLLSDVAPARMTESPPLALPQSTPALPIAVVEEGSQAATIENVLPPLSAQDSGAVAARSVEPETMAAQDEGEGLSAPEAGNRMPLRALAEPNSAAQSRSAAAAAGDEGRPAPKSVAAKRTPGRAGEKGKTTPVPDSDAALLAALVAHDAGTPITLKSAPAPSAKRSNGFDPKRDVVVDDKKVSTAELVRRCGTLGLLEGFLCKTRICESRQGTDPACPQRAGPAAKGG